MKIEKKSSLRSQISGQLRDAIMRGKLSAGSKLPPTQELAKQWNTPAANVHAALAVLVKEGLLLRKPGVGTVVASRERKLSTIAVYMSFDGLGSVFNCLLLKNIKQILRDEKIECRVIIENREQTGYAQLADLADKRQIQGVIAPTLDRYKLVEIKKIPVPFSCLTSARIKNRVPLSHDVMVDRIIEAVRLQGGSSLGIINASSDSDNPQESGEIERHNAYLKLFAALKEAGIENRPEWNHIAKDQELAKSMFPHFAYEGVNKIWQAEEKPDSLFVFPDDLASGALLAVAMNNVKIPNDLNLILHRNSGNEILCPVPCYFIENSVHDMARGLIDLVKDQFNGKELNPIELEYKLVKHQP